MAHSTVAVIAARKNHAPHLTPVRKSPIALPLNLLHAEISSTVAGPQHHKDNFSDRNTLSTERHNRLGNDDPDLVRHLGGWGTEDRGRALGKENRP